MNDIMQAVVDCVDFQDPQFIVQCVEDIIGAGSDCFDCICVLITQIGNLFGQDWHC